MAISQAQRIAKAKYQQEKRTLIAAEVSKIKGEEYRAKAASLGLSLSALIQQGIESYEANHTGEDFKPALATNKLSADEKALIDLFRELPADVSKSFLKVFVTINQLMKDQNEAREEQANFVRHLVEENDKLSEENMYLRQNQDANQPD